MKATLLCLLLALPVAAETLLEEAERIHAQDPARSMQLVEQALRGSDVKQRMAALKMQCSWTIESNPDAIVPLATASLKEAQRWNDPSALSALYTCRGYGFEYAGQIEQAHADYERAVEEGRRSPDRSDLAQALLLRGDIDYYRGAFADALTGLQEAYQIYVALGKKKQQNSVLSSIANLYADARVGQYDRAIEYYRQLLAANQEAGSISGLANDHYNLASTYERKGNLSASLIHFRKSLALEQQRGDREEAAYVRRSIGIILTKMGRFTEALQMLDEALAELERPDRVAMTRLSRGVTLNRVRRFDEALRDLEIARVYYEKDDNARFLEKVQEQRAVAFEGIGDWRRAFAARSAQLELERKLATQLREEHTSRLRVQFDTEKKEADNRALLRERKNAERIRSLQTTVIVLGSVLLLILAGLVVRSILKARRLRVMAMTDELTRLPNRRALLLFAEEQLARKQTFSLVAFDIDHFKRVNDTYGHDVGDEVLRRVADTCRGALRGHDRLGRTGGEEFIVVLPRTTAAMAMEIAERLRDAVASSDGTPQVTISLGVSEWMEGDSFATLSKRADESLYRAKEGGRNRVEVAVA